MTQDTRTEIDAAVEHALNLTGSEVVHLKHEDIGDAVVISVSRGKELQSALPFIDEFRDRPRRKTGFATLTNLEDFILHVQHHGNEHSAVFVTGAGIRAVYDYNEGSEGAANFCAYGSIYEFPMSDEWKAWVPGPGKMSQAQFAELLEDRLADVLEPDDCGPSIKRDVARIGMTLATPSSLLTLSRGLEVHVEGKVAEHTKLLSGEAQVVFETTHKDGKGEPLRVPGAFAIGIPVFKGGERYQISVRLRYRVHAGAITWEFNPHRPDLVLEHAKHEVIETVKRGVGETHVYEGSPER